MKRSDSHLSYYTSLGGVFLAGILLILHFAPDRNLQFVSVAAMGLAYVLLGIFHHILSHDLVLKIVVEYILIATLGVTLVYFVLRGGFGI